eukprot:2900861-Rhodomonas_salina.4
MTDSSTPPPSPEPSFILRGHNAVVHSIAFLNPAAGILAAADEQGLVRGWDLESRRPKFEFFAGNTPVLAVRAVADETLFTQSKAGLLQLWSIERAGTEVGSATRAEGSVKYLADIHSFCKSVLLRPCSSYGELAPIAFPHGPDAVGLWDTRANMIQSLVSPQTSPTDVRKTGACTALAALDFRYLCGAYEDGGVRVWDIRKQWPLTIQDLHTEPVFGLSVMASSKPGCAACASGGADGCVIISKIQGVKEEEQARQTESSITETGRMPIQAAGKRGINGICIRNDGKIAAAGCWDGRVRLFGVKKPRQLASLQVTSACLRACCAAPGANTSRDASAIPRGCKPWSSPTTGSGWPPRQRTHA